MSFANKPTFIIQPFANNGLKNSIPNTTASDGYASYDQGFPEITMQPKESGGLPPRGQDMNGILNNGGSKFDVYAQMGGTYSLNEEILNNGGYAKNSIVYQDDGVYRSMVDNNTDNFITTPSVIGSTWQLIIDYSTSQGSNGVPGQLSFFARTDIPAGWLRCDGTQYTKSSFPDFWDKYLTQNKLPTCSYGEYATEISDNNGNCGKFAVDLVNLTFKVPTIQGQVFISQALASGDIGKFNAESLPNIKGAMTPNGAYSGLRATVASGAFGILNSSSGLMGEGINNARGFDFDASRSSSVYRNGAKVQPNNIQFPIFVCVANVQVPVSEAQYNGFIDGLNNKANIDLSNAVPSTVLYQQGLFTTITTSGNQWAIEYFTDSTKTNRVWLRQGEYSTDWATSATTTINFLKPFSNNQYIVFLNTVSGTFPPLIGLRTSTSFRKSGNSGSDCYYAEGV